MKFIFVAFLIAAAVAYSTEAAPAETPSVVEQETSSNLKDAFKTISFWAIDRIGEAGSKASEWLSNVDVNQVKRVTSQGLEKIQEGLKTAQNFLQSN